MHYTDTHGSCIPETGKCSRCCTKIEKFGVVSGKTEILRDVNLHIHCGELTAIIGPNGAGKSTLLKAVLGEVRHTGTLQFVSCSIDHRDKPVLGYVPQKLDFDSGSPTSVADFYTACGRNAPVWLFGTKKAHGRLVKSLEKVHAEHLADRKLGELSGGELQRLLLALALDPVPDILLLDEPVSGIDRKGMELFYNTVSDLRKKYDLSIILVSHDFDLVAEYADRVVLLNKTVEVVGTPAEVFSSRQACEMFGKFVLKVPEDIKENRHKDVF